MYMNKEEALRYKEEAFRIYKEEALRYKEAALRCKEAKEKYLTDMTDANWIEFCNAESARMKLDVRI